MVLLRSLLRRAVRRAPQQASGITLIDLVMVLAIIGILGGIALPIYQDYLHSARSAQMQAQMRRIQLLQEVRRSSHPAYVEGVWDVAGGITSLGERLGWEPGLGAEGVTFLVECHAAVQENGQEDVDTKPKQPGECASGAGYTLRATHPAAPDKPLIERTEPPR